MAKVSFFPRLFMSKGPMMIDFYSYWFCKEKK